MLQNIINVAEFCYLMTSIIYPSKCHHFMKMTSRTSEHLLGNREGLQKTLPNIFIRCCLVWLFPVWMI